MISTVMTSSTFPIIAATAMTGSLALIGILVLLGVLIQKDVTSTDGQSRRFKRINQLVNITVPPILITVIVLVIAKLSELIY